jgi:hypothetical protein
VFFGSAGNVHLPSHPSAAQFRAACATATPVDAIDSS